MDDFYKVVVKIPFCLVAGLYLVGFGFSGTNIYGQIDFLIPFERVLLLIVGMVFILVCVRLFGVAVRMVRGR